MKGQEHHNGCVGDLRLQENIPDMVDWECGSERFITQTIIANPNLTLTLTVLD